MATTDADKVLAFVRLKGPAKANEIAKALSLERSAVNSILYGMFRGRVRQGRDYAWSLAGDHVGNEVNSVPTNSHAKLFAYYLDCLSQDDDSGVRTFADSKFDLDYAEIDALPFDESRTDLDTEALRKLHGRQRSDSRKKTLWLG